MYIRVCVSVYNIKSFFIISFVFVFLQFTNELTF